MDGVSSVDEPSLSFSAQPTSFRVAAREAALSSSPSIPDLPVQRPSTVDAFLDSSNTGAHSPRGPASRAIGAFPFPSQASTVRHRVSNPSGVERVPGSRSFCSGSRPLPKLARSARDRFIPIRRSPTSSTRSFHMSRPLYKLSSLEKLRRQRGGSPDPFGSLEQHRALEAERITPVRAPPRRLHGLRVGSTGSTGVLSLRRESASFLNRQASAGAVWNVGGGAAAPANTGPIAAVPNGRGGHLGSGTNAPMYNSRFLDCHSHDQDLRKHERRLALALDFDQSGRVFDFGRPSEASKALSPTNLGASAAGRVSWRDNEWIKDEGPSSPSLLDRWSAVAC